MIEVTGATYKQAWADRVMPPVEQVAPGLWSIPVPIPRNPLRYVIVHALERPDGIAIIDAGWDTPEAWDALVSGIATAGYGVADVKDILVTHMHADHYGLAGRVREESGARILMHPADADLLHSRYVEPELLMEGIGQMLVEAGVSPSEADELANASMGVRRYVSVAEPDLLVEDGDRVDVPGWDLVAIWTPGHSPGHLCFYERERKLAFTGDHVLPRITPNVSLQPQRRDPLADYLDSLRKVRDLEAVEVLPAHEYRFRGLDIRVDELVAHHQARLDEIAQVIDLSPGSTCWEIAPRLTWSRSWEETQGFLRRAATGETFAHLALLERLGRARREGVTAARWYRAGPH